LKNGESELKGSRFLASNAGQKRMYGLLTDVVGAFGTPFFVLMERRFSIAARLVDVFLDPAHQAAVDWLPTSAMEERQELSDLLHRELPPSTLEFFARAYRDPSAAAFESVLKLVIGDLSRLRRPTLASAFGGALVSLERICAAEIRGDQTSTHGQWAGLNIPAFIHLLRYVDRWLDGRGTYAVVHDVTIEFQDLFERLSGMISLPGSADVDFPLDRGKSLRALLRNFTGFVTRDSLEESCLQAADLVAASTGRAAKLALNGASAATQEGRRMCKLALSPLLQTDGLGEQIFAGVFASRSTVSAIARLLGDVRPASRR